MMGELPTETVTRRLLVVGFVYVVLAGAISLLSYLALGPLALPGWTMPLVVALSVLGFPIALAVAWAYDRQPPESRRGPVRPLPVPHLKEPESGMDEGSLEDVGRTPARSEGERWERVQHHLDNLIDETPERRRAYLDGLANVNPSLRTEVEVLLHAHDSAGPLDSLVDWLRDGTGDPDLEPSDTIGQYELKRRLGGGGMGVVYEAFDERLARRVALKFLAPSISSDEKAKRRFLVEARAAAALDHPNICTILEVGETSGGHLFLAMPFYDGETLRSRIERGPLEPARALDVARQVAEGLGAAHRRGIVHRDMKPANVMLTTRDVAKIVDFGVAKVKDAGLTRTGAALGTVSYMSPEQARGEKVDHRTDLWSLGVVLFEMLTGRRPFVGAEEEAVRTAILSTPPPSLRAERPKIAPMVGPILERALAKDRESRYGGAGEVLADLQAACEGGSIPEVGEAAGALLGSGERRICSVLVTKLGHHDRLLEELSMEDFRSVERRIEAAVAEAVTSEGGEILSAAGDRFEAAFGIPVAHEDDGRRALRAALAIRDRLRVIAQDVSRELSMEIRSRCGVDSGYLAVRKKEDVLGYEASGRPLRVARELARRAPEGEILITTECRRLVTGGFETGSAQDVELSGEEGLVTAHTVVSAGRDRGALEMMDEGGLTEFRGRRDELKTLSRSAYRAESEGGFLVQVVGEPGVGKSRLVHEFTRGLDEGRYRVFTGRCLPVSKGSSYAPIAQAVRRIVGVGEGEEGPSDPAGVVRRLLEMGEEIRDSIPLILRLLSLSHPDHPFPKHLQGDQVRLAVVESVAGLFSLSASDGPLILIFEDWHWADEASSSVLRQLAEVAASFPLLIVVTMRPGYGVDFHDLPDVSTISLEPLAPEPSAALLSSVLGADSAQEELARVIAARTSGNPFYIEEVGADLIEQGVVTVDDGVARLLDEAEVRLPDSVQAVIRARLDRVDPSARRTLFAASVIGREFTRSLLSEVVEERASLDGPLATLKVSGLIQQTRVLPEPAYRFKHALTQEVTYESLLKHERRRLHLRAAEALEERSEGATRPYELLAHHYARARGWLRAMRYGIEAARRSLELSENADALVMLDRVTDDWALHVDRSPEADRLLREGLFLKEQVLDVTGRRQAQQEVIDRLRTLVERADDERDRIELDLRQGDLLSVRRHYDEAAPLLERAVERSRAHGDPEMRSKSLRSLGMLAWHKGTADRALQLLEEALEVDAVNQNEVGELFDLQNISTVLLWAGEAERALEVAERMADFVEEHEIVVHEHLAVYSMARCYRAMGNLRQARRLYERCAESLDRAVFGNRTFTLNSLANIQLELGEVEDALETYEQAIAEARRLRQTEGLAQTLDTMAGVLEGLGREREAVPLLEEARPLFESLDDREARAVVTARLASLYGRTGRFQEAVAAWGSVRRMARELGDRSLALKALEGLASANREHFAQDDLAIPLYEEALEMALDLDDQKSVARILNSLGVIAWNQGDWDGARRHYQRALEAARAHGSSDETALILTSLGAVHRKLGNVEAAEEVLEEAVTRCSEPDPNPRLRGYALGVLGDALFDRRELDRAERAYMEALDLRRSLGDEHGEGWMLVKLSRVEERRGALDRVRELNGRAYEIAVRMDDDELMQASTAQERY